MRWKPLKIQRLEQVRPRLLLSAVEALGLAEADPSSMLEATKDELARAFQYLKQAMGKGQVDPPDRKLLRALLVLYYGDHTTVAQQRKITEIVLASPLASWFVLWRLWQTAGWARSAAAARLAPLLERRLAKSAERSLAPKLPSWLPVGRPLLPILLEPGSTIMEWA